MQIYIIISMTACPIGLAMILAIMFVSICILSVQGVRSTCKLKTILNNMLFVMRSIVSHYAMLYDHDNNLDVLILLLITSVVNF